MRMSRRAGIYGAGAKDMYLFNGGAVPGYTWSEHSTSYASTTISTYLEASASIGQGEVYSNARAYLTISADLTDYSKAWFTVEQKNSGARITVDGSSVPSGTGDVSYDISGMTGTKEIRLDSGSVSKTVPEGSVSSSIKVTKVWLSK